MKCLTKFKAMLCVTVTFLVLLAFPALVSAHITYDEFTTDSGLWNYQKAYRSASGGYVVLSEAKNFWGAGLFKLA